MLGDDVDAVDATSCETELVTSNEIEIVKFANAVEVEGAVSVDASVIGGLDCEQKLHGSWRDVCRVEGSEMA